METFLNFINKIGAENLTVYLSFFAITVASQLIGTLRAIFVANKAGFMAYVTVAIDALLYSLLVNALAKQTAFTIFLFVIGRLIGTAFANLIESQIALGIYDIDIYVKSHDKQQELQTKLLESGISSTMHIGTFSDSDVRWSNNIQIKRKDMKQLYKILDELEIKNPTMVIKNAKKVTGRINDRVKKLD